MDILDEDPSKSAWSPATTIQILLMTVCSVLLPHPNVEDPLVPEIAVVYVRDRQQYNNNAQLYTQKYATGKPPYGLEFLTLV